MLSITLFAETTSGLSHSCYILSSVLVVEKCFLRLSEHRILSLESLISRHDKGTSCDFPLLTPFFPFVPKSGKRLSMLGITLFAEKISGLSYSYYILSSVLVVGKCILILAEQRISRLSWYARLQWRLAFEASSLLEGAI